MRRTILCMILLLISAIAVKAYDNYDDTVWDSGVYYGLYTSSMTAEVINQSQEITGNITIKENVKKNNKTYSVVSIASKAFENFRSALKAA